MFWVVIVILIRCVLFVYDDCIEFIIIFDIGENNLYSNDVRSERMIIIVIDIRLIRMFFK